MPRGGASVGGRANMYEVSPERARLSIGKGGKREIKGAIKNPAQQLLRGVQLKRHCRCQSCFGGGGGNRTRVQ